MLLWLVFGAGVGKTAAQGPAPEVAPRPPVATETPSAAAASGQASDIAVDEEEPVVSAPVAPVAPVPVVSTPVAPVAPVPVVATPQEPAVVPVDGPDPIGRGTATAATLAAPGTSPSSSSAAAKDAESQKTARSNATPADAGPMQFGSQPATLSGFPSWLRLSGYLQAQAVLYDRQSVDEIDPSTGQSLNEQRILIPRAIVGVSASRGIFGGRILFDGNTINGVTARLLAAEISVRSPWGDKDLPPAALSVGLMRIPFGQEVQESAQVRLLLEPTSTARALFPGNFDLGALLFGGWRFLRYQLAAMNGNPVGEDDQFRAREPNQSKDFVGRVGVDISLNRGIRVLAGVSAVVGQGFHAGTPLTKDEVQWRDVNQDGIVQITELEAISGRAATPSQNFDRFALGGDLRVVIPVPKLGNSTVYGEVVSGSNMDRAFLMADPVAAGGDLREFGWHIGLNQELTRHALFGIRYDRYNPDRDRTDKVGADVVPAPVDYSTLAVAAAWQYQNYARLVLQYQYDRSPFGRDTDGSAAAWVNQRLTLRAQLGF